MLLSNDAKQIAESRILCVLVLTGVGDGSERAPGRGDHVPTMQHPGPRSSGCCQYPRIQTLLPASECGRNPRNPRIGCPFPWLGGRWGRPRQASTPTAAGRAARRDWRCVGGALKHGRCTACPWRAWGFICPWLASRLMQERA